jgi:hypothetical protein
MVETLPDSRLSNLNGSVLMDWPLDDGTIVRIECVPIFCANCGKPYGFVPKDNITFVCWFCDPCFEKYGKQAGMLYSPDHEFRENVKNEMETRFGRHLTAEELLANKDNLGTGLNNLIKESPYGH